MPERRSFARTNLDGAEQRHSRWLTQGALPEGMRESPANRRGLSAEFIARHHPKNNPVNRARPEESVALTTLLGNA